MQIEWIIKFGDILTSLTIIVSVTALIVSWTKDRKIKENEQANAVRTAAATAITKLDRWQALNLSLYQELQPVFVETSEMLINEYDIIKARDYLWKTINNQRTKILAIVLDEKISTSYIDLLAYFPDIRSRFINMFKILNELEENISIEFLESSQQDVLSFDNKQKIYTSAMLGNALRTTAAIYKEKLHSKSIEANKPVKEFLFEIIAKTNSGILSASRISKNH